jgi:hypothetical protein
MPKSTGFGGNKFHGGHFEQFLLKTPCYEKQKSPRRNSEGIFV